MKVLTFGIVIFICVCSFSYAIAAGFGDTCSENGNCTDIGQECADNGTCACYTDNSYNNDGNKCVKELASSCSDTLPCNDAFITCESGFCKCISSTYDDNGSSTPGGSCKQKHDLGQTCTVLTSGTVGPDQCKADNAECSSVTVTCQCKIGYTASGSLCSDIDDCAPNPCQNDGTCADGVNDYTCTCITGYTGKNCQTNIDDCASNPCQNDVTCADGVNDYTCTCITGYTGKNCQTNIDDCATNPCQNDGTCADGVNDYTCTCITGYTGKNCQTNIDDCVPNPCQNDVTCADGVNDYTCTCITGYTGKNCQTNIDDCFLNPCLNGGTCTDGLNDFTCACNSGFSSKRCNKAALGASCFDQDTTCQDTNSECGVGKKCVCKSSHYDSDGTNNIGGTCMLKVVLGGQCPTPSIVVPATTTCLDTIATCKLDNSYYKCLCPNTHYDDNGSNTYGGKCESKKMLGERCPLTVAIGSSATCVDSNARCRSSGGSSYKCQCSDTYYDNDGTSNIGGTCITKVNLGADCPQPDACATPWSECSASKKCVCQSSYYDTNGADSTGGQCYPKVGLGSNCPRLNACKTTNAGCVGGTCVCDSQYYDSNGLSNNGGSCILRISLGSFCKDNPPTNIDQCSDSSATCVLSSGSYRCTCNRGYHQEGSKCVANKPLGQTCSVPTDCSDPAADCLGGKCTCAIKYYDDNGFAAAGTCASVTNLQVTNVEFPSSSIKTNEITITWSAPVNYKQYINRYNVEWKRLYGSNIGTESQSVAASSTSLTLSRGIASGRAYTVTIISINDQTQSNSQRITSVTKQQAAKPTATTRLDWSNSDQDATTGTIKVAWVAAAGYISQYQVELLDGTTVIRSKIVQSPQAEFQSSELRDGYRYNVKIEARSESYDSGKRVPGEIFTAEFKTMPQKPDPPQNGFCKDPTDKSLTLEWSVPTDTKGDLVRYHINVYQSSNTVKFIVSTTGTETQLAVSNLDPGTPYTFRIYTENEKYNSSSYSNVTTECKTKAQMSEPPTNLEITGITSRSFDISWMKPVETHSAENYGYVLQIKDDRDICVKEMIYKCSDCTDEFQISELNGLCSEAVRVEEGKTKQELEDEVTYSASLKPDIAYTVTVTAINDAGRGYPANKTGTTLEEAPQKPFNVAVSEIKATSLKVTWNIQGPRPGKTTFTIELEAEKPAATQNFTISGFDTREYMAQGLEEFWNYNVTVTANTSIGAKTSERTQEYTTKSAAPGEVSEFNIKEAPAGNYTAMLITWKAPTILERNSIIKSYSFEHYASGKVTSTRNFPQADFDTYNVTLDVIPEETYNISVYAINEGGQKGEHITRIKTAPAGVPINIEDTLGVDIIPKSSVKETSQRGFTIAIVPEFFTEDTYGTPKGTGLVACAKDCDFSGITNVQDFDQMDNWKTASEKGFSLWRPTNRTWLVDLQRTQQNSRRKRSTTKLDYAVGSDDCSKASPGGYCNGPLEPGTSYILVAVSCTSGGCLQSKEYGPFVTLAVPVEDNNIPMIIGIVVGVVAVLVIAAVIGFILLRRRRREPSKMKHVSEGDDDEFSTVDPAVAKIPRKRPIELNEIEVYVNNMHKDSNLLFSAEYEELKTLSPKHACEAADREENRMRNRYINIIPFDHTRVKLSTNGEDDSADYINANYLPGYSSPREYIGCQGPIPGTIDDFWRMTWEQNVSVIVMLTLCKEGQKIKCEQYWPDEVGEPKQYGDVIVEITSYSNIRTYDYRMFKITNGNTTRVVKHFHFLSWLDFQANVHHDIILDFIQHVRQHVQPPDTSGPMIIHCSAGVGRTGTYIALDHLMQFINEHDFDVNIDIFDLVLKLRENRQHMVQTEQQYVFIHDCVKEIMDRKRRQMENIYENQAFSAQDENIYQNEQSLYANVSVGNSEQNTEL